jgi:GntR family transcriptional regulator
MRMWTARQISTLHCMYEFRPDTPIWVQLTDILRSQILSGEIPPRGKLPSISRLMQDYGIADQTAQKAINALKTEGLVRSVRGLGTFVADPEDRSKDAP